MERFQNKYRIASARAAWWDYGWAGAYFITICTAQRHHYFGNIDQGRMQSSSVGILADVFWHEIRHHAQQVELGTFVVMPNHIHGILILTDNNGNNANVNPNANIETRHALSLPQTPTPSSQRFQNQGKTPFRRLLGDTNRRLPNTRIDWVLTLGGRPVSMTISSGTILNTSVLTITLNRILHAGMSINSTPIRDKACLVST